MAVPLAAFWPVKVTAAGRGSLQPASSIRTLRAPAAGVVIDVQAHAGDVVEKGATLARLRKAGPQAGERAAGAGDDDIVLLKATESGQLDGLTLVPGEVVAFAAPLGRIVPQGPLRRAVVAVQEFQRAFINVGTTVEISVDQLPYKRFGHLTATVTAVGPSPLPTDDLADVDDVKFARPEGYLVELRLEDTLHYQTMLRWLRPGMRVWAMFPVRKTTVLATLFPTSG